MKGARSKTPARVVTAQEREAFRQEIERQFPGYLNENLKLTTIVKIFTGLRVLYGLYYLMITIVYGLSVVQGLFTIFCAFVFYLWYSWMLKAGKGIAVLMLCLRGFSIVSGGVSILQMSFWLPYSLIFTLTTACVMEFSEAIFCIYILFNRTASTVIRLNREGEMHLVRGVPTGTLERMAEYKNPYSEDAASNGEAEENEPTAGNGNPEDREQQNSLEEDGRE